MNKILTAISFLLLSLSAHAVIRLPALAGSNMVLQRDRPLRIWGYGNPGEQVSLSFAGQTGKALTAADGKWKIALKAMPAGGPYQLVLQGTNRIVLENILLGDVWVCSGQSNMEFSLKEEKHAQTEVPAATDPQLRLFMVQKGISLTPREDCGGKWQVCSPAAAADFPAIGYYFGRQLISDIKVPVGLINASWGGTVAESWISREGLSEDPDFAARAAGVAAFDTLSYNTLHRKLNADWIRAFNAADQGFVGGRYTWAGSDAAGWPLIRLPQPWEFSGLPELWELDGVVWFSKEIDLPAAALSGKAVLSLGVIQNADITFINGTRVASTADSWNLRRRYVLPEGLLKAGRNRITVRVENYGGDGGFRSEAAALQLETAAGNFSLAGDWGYRVGYKLDHFDRPEREVGPNTLPTLMFNQMIAPVTGISIKGVLWYQGESNWDRPEQYQTLFPELIRDWRKQFGQGDFPFLFVQLAAHHAKLREPGPSAWAAVREAQAMALSLKHTGMVTAIDLGDPANIHPVNKRPVGLRLAALAGAQVYGRKVSAYSPALLGIQRDAGAMLLQFKDVEKGLKTSRGTRVGGFQLAGNDRHFYWAEAEITGPDRIRVHCKQVPEPVEVRYAWEDNPEDANVVNTSGLPLLPFRKAR